MNRFLRPCVVAVTIVAWFAISNHCALAAINPGQGTAALHSHCHSDQPAPDRNDSSEELPCCKVLRATVIDGFQVADYALKDWQPLPDLMKAALLQRDDALHITAADELDTGPPFVSSFAELILQRSVLAHAPPSLV